MSRVGKKIINIPEKVEVVKDADILTVKGPLGTLTRSFRDDIEVKISDKEITLVPRYSPESQGALWGTYGSHILNMIEGVTKGFKKDLIIEGVGYKINVKGENVVLEIGLSHDVPVKIPEGVKVTVEKGNFSIAGYDKEAVMGFAAKLKSLKPVEPYKGKGIRYVGEQVLRKQGKKTAA